MSGSKKRGADQQTTKDEVKVAEQQHLQQKASVGNRILSAAEIENLEFEDPYGDEYEEEEMDEEQDEEDEEDDEDGEMEDLDDKGGEMVGKTDQVDAAGKAGKKGKASGAIDVSASEAAVPKQVWRPGVDKLEAGEELEYDPSAYIMYHALQTEWPCLSFDLIKDNLGDNRQRFPHTLCMVAGSQADKMEKNKITFLKVSELHKTHAKGHSDEDSDSESDEDENLDEDPTIEHMNVPHIGGVNRLRSMPIAAGGSLGGSGGSGMGVVATMSDTAQAHIFDLSVPLQSLMARTATGPRLAPTLQQQKPVTSFLGHQSEGFAVDWSSVVTGRLATGDCSGKIHIWNSASTGDIGGGWQVDPLAYSGHTSSVEDLQWSPTEATVFASASADKSVCIWDTRGRKGPQIGIDDAHTEDVNVISWNKQVGYLLASGSDDGSFKVWDLRTIQKSGSAPLAHFTYHKQPVTSLEWAPHDESVLCVSSADDQVTVWDLSVEADEEEETGGGGAKGETGTEEFPPQLLFIHQGQHNVKELHFHPQIPGAIVTTAEDSFNIFKPAINVVTSS